MKPQILEFQVYDEFNLIMSSEKTNVTAGKSTNGGSTTDVGTITGGFGGSKAKRDYTLPE